MKYFDAFSGYGGFSLGIQQAYERLLHHQPQTTELQTEQDIRGDNGNGIQGTPTCIGYSEINPYAISVYQKHFPEHKNYGNIQEINPAELPDFDLFTGGFPCQSFSIAGKRGGFEDTRGTLIFDVFRILRAKQPRWVLLENVKGLLSHDGGRTFKIIISSLAELGYCVEWQVLNAKNFGVPQNRERVFIIGHRTDTRQTRVFPIELPYGQAKEITSDERVYFLSSEVSSYAKELLLFLEYSEAKNLSKLQMQELLKKIKHGIQKKECSEIEREPQDLRQQPEGDIQEVETLGAFLESRNDSRAICGVVQIPTEDMLLLWDRRINPESSTRRLQQQDTKDDDRPNGLYKKLRHNEHYPLLLTVQPYQGGLFYSIGDGRDWEFIYKAEVEKICTPTLSSILEESPNEKYFLSEKATESIMNRMHKGTTLHTPSKQGGISTEEAI